MKPTEAELRSDKLKSLGVQIDKAIQRWKHAEAEWKLRRKALLASPGFVERAQLARAVEKMGHGICYRHYPDAPDCGIALRRVMAVFSTGGTLLGPSESTQVERHAQCALVEAVRWLCLTKEGPKQLAQFIVAVVKSKADWPRIPAGMPFDLADHFNEQRRFDFIQNYHELPGKKLTDEAKCHRWILRAVVCDDNLSSALGRLGYDAERRKKGWHHLRGAFTKVFTFITRSPSASEKLLDFELNFARELIGNTTQKQRVAWGLDSKSDRSTRPLTRKEHLVLAQKQLGNIARCDGGGKSSADTLITRARKAAMRRIKSS